MFALIKNFDVHACRFRLRAEDNPLRALANPKVQRSRPYLAALAWMLSSAGLIDDEDPNFGTVKKALHPRLPRIRSDLCVGQKKEK